MLPTTVCHIIYHMAYHMIKHHIIYYTITQGQSDSAVSTAVCCKLPCCQFKSHSCMYVFGYSMREVPLGHMYQVWPALRLNNWTKQLKITWHIGSNYNNIVHSYWWTLPNPSTRCATELDSFRGRCRNRSFVIIIINTTVPISISQ